LAVPPLETLVSPHSKRWVGKPLWRHSDFQFDSTLSCDLAEFLFAIVTVINHGPDFIPRCLRKCCSPSPQFGIRCLIFHRRLTPTEGT
jgi:hypothetical protein